MNQRQVNSINSGRGIPSRPSPEGVKIPRKTALPSVDRYEISLSYLLKIVLLGATIYAAVLQDYFYIFSGCIALLASFMPAILERRWQLVLPSEVDLIITAFICVHFILGELSGYYYRFNWFDLILHSYSGFMLGLVGFLWAYILFYTSRLQAKPLFIVVFAVSLAMAIGGVWEIFEYGMDKTFGFNMQKSGLDDTMSDLIVDFIGAIVIGAFGMIYFKTHRDGFIRRAILRVITFYKLRKRRHKHKLDLDG